MDTVVGFVDVVVGNEDQTVVEEVDYKHHFPNIFCDASLTQFPVSFVVVDGIAVDIVVDDVDVFDELAEY